MKRFCLSFPGLVVMLIAWVGCHEGSDGDGNTIKTGVVTSLSGKW